MPIFKVYVTSSPYFVEAENADVCAVTMERIINQDIMQAIADDDFLPLIECEPFEDGRNYIDYSIVDGVAVDPSSL